jgi:hypothetical protein
VVAVLLLLSSKVKWNPLVPYEPPKAFGISWPVVASVVVKLLGSSAWPSMK